MLRLLLLLSSALASLALVYCFGPAVLLVCPALALATVVWSMQDSQAFRDVLEEQRHLDASARQEPPELEHRVRHLGT